MSKSTNASKHAAAGVNTGVGSGAGLAVGAGVGRHAGTGPAVGSDAGSGAGSAGGKSPVSTVSAAPVISVSKLNVDLAGRRVLNDVTMSAAAGELVGLLGPNGAGKTTLLRSILHLIPTVSGSIAIGGDTSKNARKHIGYVPQRQQFAWDFPISVLDTVVLGRVKTIGWFRRPGEKDYIAAIEALDRTGMTKFRDRPVGDLSGGQRQRVLVARALALQPTVLLLDEPFTGLDMPTQELLSELFATLAGEGETLIMSTHDIAGAVSACSRIVLLNRTVVADGTPQELNDPELWRSTFSIRPDNPLLAVVEQTVQTLQRKDGAGLVGSRGSTAAASSAASPASSTPTAAIAHD
ncbi:anchored repeat-type ABC transporter ATP-binding subunit [Bifidobacterium tibiigranuli]|uniref:anchored repeat-type ABC transporter ATP-binding subunit n=1 Tax=Bifidobacterium tibiigranuli TaxID=2172043 RepID=UPI0026EC17FE|nr:anchored repeat-type ABC transporter ATP-binding subunit [Bifidobacterium tibiigranuli]